MNSYSFGGGDSVLRDTQLRYFTYSLFYVNLETSRSNIDNDVYADGE